MQDIPKKLVEIAISQLGVSEEGNTNCGEVVNQYKAATNLPPKESWPWCAAFVCWVVKQSGAKETPGFKLPTTASAFDFINWSLKQDNTTTTIRSGMPKPGDIVVFTFSHIGIVEKVVGDAIHTIEGNTDRAGSREGGSVWRKVRRLGQIKARIRINL